MKRRQIYDYPKLFKLPYLSYKMEYFEEKQINAFQTLLSNIKENLNIRQYYQDKSKLASYSMVTDYGSKITVLGLNRMADCHVFEDNFPKWGITLDQATIIRGFFINQTPEESFMFLYNNFQKYFEGESKQRLLNRIGKNEVPKSLEKIPLF